MRKSLRILVAATAAAAVVGSITGCTTNTSSGATDEPIKLSFLTFETPALQADFWDPNIAETAAKQPGLTIEKLISTSDRTGYAKTLQASGQFPDLLSSITTADFTKAGLLAPFSESWLKDNFLLPDATADVDGKTYAPPVGGQVVPMVYYNKAIFAANDIEVPTTYSEFVAAVKKLRAANITPIELGGLDAWSASYPIVSLFTADVLGSNPAWVSDRFDDKVKFTDKDVEKSVQKMVDLVAMGAFSDTALSVDYATANTDFLAGNAAMYPMGSWFSGSGYMTPEQSEDFGVFLWPRDDGKLVTPTVVGGTMSVSSQSKHVPEALKFAEDWTLSPGTLKPLVESDGLIPMLKTITLEDLGVTVTPLFTAGSDFMVSSDTTKVPSFGAGTGADALPPGFGAAFQTLSQALFTNTDVKAQLAALDEAWDTAANQ